jgi:hypothetical protein
MVNGDGGQLYTIEGFAAALIMIITAFLVVNATSVYTAGDTHISDMQLEALGTDALKMMDTPISSDSPSPLQNIMGNLDATNRATFTTMFLNYTNDIQFYATYTCRNTGDNSITNYPISYSRNMSGEDHSVRATKWVIVNNNNICSRNDDQAILVEVLLWRD